MITKHFTCVCGLCITYIHASYGILAKVLFRDATSMDSKHAIRIQKLFKTSEFYQGTLTTKYALYAYQDLGPTIQL